MTEQQHTVTDILNAPRVRWKFHGDTEWQYGKPIAYTDQPAYVIERESDGMRLGVLASFAPQPTPTLADELDQLPRDTVVMVENDSTHRWLAWKSNAGDWDVIVPRGDAERMSSAELPALGTWVVLKAGASA